MPIRKLQAAREPADTGGSTHRLLGVAGHGAVLQTVGAAATRPGKIQDRKATNRRSVANAFAPTNAAISVSALAPGAHTASASSTPVVSPRPRPKTARPCSCWVTAPERPRGLTRRWAQPGQRRHTAQGRAGRLDVPSRIQDLYPGGEDAGLREGGVGGLTPARPRHPARLRGRTETPPPFTRRSRARSPATSAAALRAVTRPAPAPRSRDGQVAQLSCHHVTSS